MRLVRPRDVTARLGELDLPVLVTSGGYDEMTPALIQQLVDGIRGAQAAVFEQAPHLAIRVWDATTGPGPGLRPAGHVPFGVSGPCWP